MIARIALISVLALSALCAACDDECGGSIEDLCEDSPSVCKDHLTFDDALERALQPISGDYVGAAYIAVCDGTRFVHVGGGLYALFYSYDKSGELIGYDSFSDQVVEGEECPSPEYGEGASYMGCTNACTLYGSPPLFEEGGPPCEGEIAEPVRAACEEIATMEYEQPACAECVCDACYPFAVHPRRGEVSELGVVVLEECLKTHCAEPCEIRDDER